MSFLKEYWIWIVIPFVVAIGGLTLLYMMSGGGSFSDFTYNVF